MIDFASHVTILVRGDEPTASPILQERVAARDDITVWLNSEITEIQGKHQLDKVLVRHRDTNQIKAYHPDGIFVFIGMTPNTSFLPSPIQCDTHKFIITNPNLETTAPGIFAAGDCRKTAVKQVVSAAGEGAAAAIHIREYLRNR